MTSLLVFFIGATIGLVMGLTGAGGALIAIGLFIQFLGMSLKEATVYSLVAVIIASLTNFIFQRKYASTKLSFLLVLFSTFGSLIATPYKKFLPEILVSILLGAVSLYSLYGVWKPKSNLPFENDSLNSQKLSYPLTILIGLILGSLTTFTGLGGGVLMLPVLMGFYGLDQNRAVATSLITVALSSLTSLLIQVFGGAKFEIDGQLVIVIFGILASAYVVKIFMKKIDQSKMGLIRKIVFTFVVLVTLIKVFNV
jgi:uncharacterized membrane protein YfcA